jgi:hypothetical protein
MHKEAKKKKKQTNKDYENFLKVKNFTEGHSLGMLASIAGTPLAGFGAMAGASALPELEDKHLNEMLESANLVNRVRTNKPTKDSAGSFLEENAYFHPVPEEYQERVNRVGDVSSSSKKTWKPGLIAHELGHADIEANPGLARFLQRNAYHKTRDFNEYTLGMLPALAAFALNAEEDEPLKGALKGGLVGAGANAGVLIPEFEASRRGAKHLMKSSLSLKNKLLNILTLFPAFGSYLLNAATPGAIVGGYRAYHNKKRKNKNKKKTKQAEFFSKIAGFIKAAGSDIDIMFDKKVETKPKDPLDGRLKKNKAIVEVKEKDLEAPKLHKHKIKIALERLKGGLGDNKSDSSFSSDELRKGTAHELEHTKNKQLAKEIAKDHLSEVKDYYSKLDKADID